MKRFLVVEDVPAVRHYLARALGRVAAPAVVREEATAAAGLEAVASFRPDLLFLDLNLGPGPTGSDVLRLVREHRPDLPVAIVTGLPPGDPLVERALRLGASAVLRKPVRLESLRELLADVDSGRKHVESWTAWRDRGGFGSRA